MSVINIELDDQLLAHIRAIAGPSVIKVEEFIRDLVTTHAGPSEDFTQEQLDAIQRGLDDEAKGRTVAHSDVVARLDAMLKP